MDKQMQIYNTLTRKKENLETIEANKCSIYSCGPTVYSFAHIGNFRYFLFVDLLRRVLLNNGYKLNHVINITDVGHLVSDADEGEDKMLKAARLENKSPFEIARFYENVFLQDCKKLNISMPEKIVRATENIDVMEEYVKKIIENGYGYETENTVYFDTSKLEDYGVLSGMNKEGQKAGARIELDNGKRNITDFALWIKAPEEHIMKWDSFFGKSYPGWHIECSAMSKKYLGEKFDIHTGGADHISIHHENEIAQSKGYCGKNPANYWVHSEFLQVDGGKMSKSLGNTYTIKDLEDKGFNALDFKFFTFSSHYRTKINFTFEALKSAQTALNKLRKLYLEHLNSNEVNEKEVEYEIDVLVEKSYQKFIQALLNDLNMPVALAEVWKIAKNKVKSKKIAETLEKMDEILGLRLSETKNVEIPEEILEMVKQREMFKKEKQYEKADQIRDEINKKGYIILDTKEGVKIEREN